VSGQNAGGDAGLVLGGGGARGGYASRALHLRRTREPLGDRRDRVLYRLALEKALAGSMLHGVGDTGIQRKVIAETIAGKLGIETKSITAEEAPQYLGFLAAFAGLDNPTSNDRTRELLGWEPTHPGWVEDVETGHYFA
jgi:hypothetical protein